MVEVVKRDFHIADVLSVTHGVLISTRRMRAVHDVLNFVTGQHGLASHQLIRAAGGLFDQLPQSVKRSFPMASDMEKYVDQAKTKYKDCWLERVIQELEDKHGQMISIEPVSTYQPDCPLEELIDRVGPEKVFPFKVDMACIAEKLRRQF